MFGQKLNRDLFNLSIMTLITVLTWAGFDVYRAFHQTEIPQVLEQQIQPLDPQLEKEVLANLKERDFISKEEAKSNLPLPVLEESELIKEELLESQGTTESASPSASED